jgi:hypothetical protein
MPGKPFWHEPTLLADVMDDAVREQIIDLLADPAKLVEIATALTGSRPAPDGNATQAADRAVEKSRQALACASARALRLGLDGDRHGRRHRSTTHTR